MKKILLTTFILFLLFACNTKTNQVGQDSNNTAVEQSNDTKVEETNESTPEEPQTETVKSSNASSIEVVTKSEQEPVEPEEVQKDEPNFFKEIKEYVNHTTNQDAFRYKNFVVKRSKRTTAFGRDIYEYEGELTLKVKKSCYRQTAGLGAHGLFGSQSEPIKKSSAFEYVESEYFAEGSIRSINVELKFEKYDQGWQLESLKRASAN